MKQANDEVNFMMMMDEKKYLLTSLTKSLLVLSFFTFGIFAQAASYSHQATPSLAKVPDNTWIKVKEGGITADHGIQAYSGGWYDPQHHQFCIFGGGHWNYSGNEVWCFDITSLKWKEMYPPDVITNQGQDQGAYKNFDNKRYPGALFKPAGESIKNTNPMSRHTYDQMEYVEGLGPVIWGGYSWGDGSGKWCEICPDTWAFDFANARWNYLYDGNNPSPNVTAGAGASAFSTADKLLYVRVLDKTWVYDPVRNNWSQLNTTGTGPYAIELTMEYDSKRNVLYVLGGSYNGTPPGLYRFDIASQTWSQLTPSGTGPNPSQQYGSGLAYDSANDVLLIHKSGTIWAYNPNNNSWAQYKSTTRPADQNLNFGRFRYDPINNGAWFVGIENEKYKTWFYRFKSSK